MGRAIVPLVSARNAVVDELVSYRRPCLPAVVRTLDLLPVPAAILRRIQPIRVGRRALHMVDLPACKMRTADIPFLALAVRGQDECAFVCADEYPYSVCHEVFLPLYYQYPLLASGLAGSAS